MQTRVLVDGQWRDDPEGTLRVANPYGGDNAVREVASTAPGQSNARERLHGWPTTMRHRSGGV